MTKSFPFSSFIQTPPKDLPPQTKENITDLSALEAEIYLHLQSLIGEEKFKSFFQNHLILKNIENQIEFLATSSLIKKMIETCYFNALSLSIEQTFGEKVPFFISLLGSTAPATALPEVEYKITQKSKSVKDFRFCLEDKPQNTQQKLNLNPSWDATKTFENFIFDEENHLLYSACLSVAQNPKRMYPLLFLHGNSGLGKTHLLNAMAYKITQMHPHLKVLLISGRDFMNEMVENIKTQTILDFRKKYTSADVLLFDDLHDLQNKKGTLSEFYYLLDDFFQKKKQMVIASYHAPKNMHGLDERIQSRICSALILDIKIPNLEIRKSILKQKAVEQDLHLNEDVVELIARSFQVNIGQLEGALIRLSAYASLFKTNIDLELAKNQLGLNLTPLKKTSLGSITTAVCSFYQISQEELKNKSKAKSVTLARHTAIYLCHKYCDETLAGIGNFFGGRDHSSILYAVRQIKTKLEKEPSFKQSLDQIENISF